MLYIINLQTLYVWSSLLTAASYVLCIGYGFFWSKQSGFEWIPTVCFGAVVFFSSTGMLPLSYIMTPELLPRKVQEHQFISFLIQSLIYIFINWHIFCRFVSRAFRFLLHYFGFKCFWVDPFFSQYWIWLASILASSYFLLHAFRMLCLQFFIYLKLGENPLMKSKRWWKNNQNPTANKWNHHTHNKVIC